MLKKNEDTLLKNIELAHRYEIKLNSSKDCDLTKLFS